jgi:hypothetical protein
MAERRFRYDGPFAEGVYVPALGKTVLPNHQVTVEDAEVADSLAQQGDWKEIGAAKQDDPPPPAEEDKG